MLDPITFFPIGVIQSDHVLPDETPIQPVFANGCCGRAEIFPEYEKGLKDLEGFSHIILLYHLHQASPPCLIIRPFLDDTPRGIFATRGPCRPNPIGLSVVRLVKREGLTLFLDDVDILDGTPLLDIKPFVPMFDSPKNTRVGWIENVDPEISFSRGRRGYRGNRKAGGKEGDTKS